MAAPIADVSCYAYSSGKAYQVAQDGDILVRRELGVRLGEVRMFFYFSNVDQEQCMYFAERKFKSMFHPLRAPKIWWRQIKEK